MVIDAAIQAERARYINRNTPTAAIGSFFVASILLIMYWGSVQAVILVAWLVLTAAIGLYRLSVWQTFRRAELTPDVLYRRFRQELLGAGFSGCSWGMGFFILLSQGPLAFQFAALFTMVVLAVLAMFSYGAYFPAFRMFFLPSVTPVFLVFVLRWTILDGTFAIGTAAFVVALWIMAVRIERLLIDSLRLRFENLELVNQLTVQKEAAESANLAKSRFLAAASHDLRQPMHALNLYLGAFAGLDLPQAGYALLAKARQCGLTMDEMFRALLDISRLDASVVQAKISAFPIATVLERIRVEFEPQARAKGLELRVVNCQAWVRSDPVLVERILRNFTANAMRYTEHGKMLIGCRHRGEFLRLAVNDTGPGIAPQEQAAVFEEFYQVGNPQRDRAQGLGLGLAIVQRLAHLLSLPVALVSNLGRGSMFAIDLPLAENGMVASPPMPAMVSGMHTLKDILVMVVDDEAVILDATRTLLEHWGCKVIVAASGIKAHALLSSSTAVPDVLICDYRLRGEEDGVSVIEMLRAEFNTEIPAMLITGDTEPARIREIEASGLRVLHKPVQEAELREVLCLMVEN